MKRRALDMSISQGAAHSIRQIRVIHLVDRLVEGSTVMSWRIDGGRGERGFALRTERP